MESFLSVGIRFGAAAISFSSGAVPAGLHEGEFSQQIGFGGLYADHATTAVCTEYRNGLPGHASGGHAAELNVGKFQVSMNSSIQNRIVDNDQLENQSPEADLIFQLEMAPSIAPLGENSGRFIRPEMFERRINDTEKRTILKVSVQLDVQDDDGKPFVLSREYNLSGHGLTAFKEDIKAWRGTPLSREELKEFNATRILINKPVVVVVAHREVGKKSLAYIELLRPIQATPSVSQ